MSCVYAHLWDDVVPEVGKKLGRLGRKLAEPQLVEDRPVVRQLLDHRLGVDYSLLTVNLSTRDGRRGAELILNRGVWRKAPHNHRHLAGAYVREGKCTLIFTEEKLEKALWSQLGLAFRVRSVKDAATASKRLSRLLAPHEGMVFGSVEKVSESEGRIEYRMTTPYRTYHVLVCQSLPEEFGIDLKKACDGTNFCNQQLFADVKGVLPETVAWNERADFTALLPCGLGKGHVQVVHQHHLGPYDLIILDPKTEVRATNRHCCLLGILSTKHARKHVWTDNQMITNLLLWSPGFLDRRVDEFTQTVRDAIGSPAAFEQLLEMQAEQRMEHDSEEEPDFSQLADLYKVLVLDHPELEFDMRRHPALFRRAFGLFRTKLLDLQKLRIPLTGQAVAHYATVDWSALLSGEFDLSLITPLLGKGEVYIPGLLKPGEEKTVYLLRQPSAPREVVRMTAVCTPELVHAYGRHGAYIVFNVYDVDEKLAVLGGGDQDDAIIVLYGEDAITLLDRTVPFINTLFGGFKKSLPVQAPAVKDPDLTLGPGTCLSLMQAFEAVTPIGFFVNRLMWFTYLICLRQKKEFSFLQFADLRPLAPSLEDIIDANNKTASVVVGLSEALDEFDQSVQQVPGFLHDRFPKYRKWKDNPIDQFISRTRSKINDLEKEITPDEQQRLEYIISYPDRKDGKLVKISDTVKKAYNQTFFQARDKEDIQALKLMMSKEVDFLEQGQRPKPDRQGRRRDQKVYDYLTHCHHNLARLLDSGKYRVLPSLLNATASIASKAAGVAALTALETAPEHQRVPGIACLMSHLWNPRYAYSDSLLWSNELAPWTIKAIRHAHYTAHGKEIELEQLRSWYASLCPYCGTDSEGHLCSFAA